MDSETAAPSQSLIHAATKALGAKKGTTATHLRVEPSENDGYIVHHEVHVDGIPSGRIPKHVLESLPKLLEHIKKTYTKDRALEETEEKSKEAQGGREKSESDESES